MGPRLPHGISRAGINRGPRVYCRSCVLALAQSSSYWSFVCQLGSIVTRYKFVYHTVLLCRLAPVGSPVTLTPGSYILVSTKYHSIPVILVSVHPMLLAPRMLLLLPLLQLPDVAVKAPGLRRLEELRRLAAVAGHGLHRAHRSRHRRPVAVRAGVDARVRV